MEYLFHILILIGIYTILSVSLSLVAGQIGILSVAHAGFYGIGAYTSALLTIQLGSPFELAVMLGMIIAVVVSLVVSLPSLRLHEDYFVIATFGFQIIIFSVFNNWIDLTRGPLGIFGIPQPSIGGWKIASELDFLILVVIWTASTWVIVARLVTSPYGRVLRAIREDEVFAQAMGKNTLWFKVSAFALSAALASSAGSLYAHYFTYIDPSSFTIIAMKLLNFVGLEKMVSNLVAELSYGQQKLLSLACCLATEARILLLDEPVAGVNPNMVSQILELMLQLREPGNQPC
jgi:branched-chain amino acid transport system permease protein